MFERFWSAYPRKVARGAAQKAWEKLKPDEQLAETMILAIDAQKRHRRKTEDANDKLPEKQRQFLAPWKHPATWINQQCWLDEIPSTTEARTVDKRKCNCGTHAVWIRGNESLCTKCYDTKFHPDFKRQVYDTLCKHNLGKLKDETPEQWRERIKLHGMKVIAGHFGKKSNANAP